MKPEPNSPLMEDESSDASSSSRNGAKLAHVVQGIALILLFLLVGVFVRDHLQTAQSLTAQQPELFEMHDKTDVCLSSPAVFLVVAAVDDEDVITEMEKLLLSMIYLTSRSLHFIFVTNSEGSDQIKDLFLKLPNLRRSISVEIVRLDVNEIIKWADDVEIDATAHHSGAWGMAKLAVPWLLPWLQKAVVLDTDMVFMKDPHELWAHAWNVSSSIPYRMPLGPIGRRSSTEMCSCVVAVNAEEARRRQVYPNRIRDSLRRSSLAVKEGKYFKLPPPLGDQAVYISSHRGEGCGRTG